MPAYNFKERFADLVKRGHKLHTVRAHRKDGKRPAAGQPFAGYTGMRTKKCRLLVRSTISRVQAIEVDTQRVVIDGRSLQEAEYRQFAIADGFTSAAEFFGFFREAHGLPFVGDLIHWTRSRRVSDTTAPKA